MATPEADIDITPVLVRRLLEEQHPDLAALPIRRVADGWDNAILRLGDELVVRLPRRLQSAALIVNEQRWLPELAAGLPLAVPAPLRVGRPGCGYPWAWSIGPWLPGTDIEHAPPADWDDVARRLGGFLAVLHQPAPPGAPTNLYRGVPLGDRTERFHAGLDHPVVSALGRARLVELWDHLVDAPPWPGPPVWLHGDVHPLNLLVHEGRLSAVIDFGDLTSGDPASDLAVAWMLLPPAARDTFRGVCAPGDDELWARARGWALALGVAFAHGDDRVAEIGRRTLAAALVDE